MSDLQGTPPPPGNTFTLPTSLFQNPPIQPAPDRLHTRCSPEARLEHPRVAPRPSLCLLLVFPATGAHRRRRSSIFDPTLPYSVCLLPIFSFSLPLSQGSQDEARGARCRPCPHAAAPEVCPSSARDPLSASSQSFTAPAPRDPTGAAAPTLRHPAPSTYLLSSPSLSLPVCSQDKA